MMTKKTSASTSVAAAGSAAGSSAAGPSAAAGATSKAAETAARASHSECEPPVGGAVSAHRGADAEVAPSPRNPGKRPRTDPPSPDIATPVAASDPPKAMDPLQDEPPVAPGRSARKLEPYKFPPPRNAIPTASRIQVRAPRRDSARGDSPPPRPLLARPVPS